MLRNRGGGCTDRTPARPRSHLWIDGALVVDNGGAHGTQWRFGSLSLASGYHSVRVDYLEHGGGAHIEVHYAGPDTGGTMQLAGEFPGTVDPSEVFLGTGLTLPGLVIFLVQKPAWVSQPPVDAERSFCGGGALAVARAHPMGCLFLSVGSRANRLTRDE